ncbi:hypothetical protein M2137_001471 [Parabacteroides sp. PFB2-10]|uniref:hypothetical protein n=1 Tax=Parabacteroides sp. PFB2-10 TaxID=1742405 RepID=UPI002475A41C|nr:hypothetical protein [Parabacteroides sp. PFB2-10]MDH6312696.1 hypothetical protein [Parabacteroides sp. PFB2-10]
MYDDDKKLVEMFDFVVPRIHFINGMIQEFVENAPDYARIKFGQSTDKIPRVRVLVFSKTRKGNIRETDYKCYSDEKIVEYVESMAYRQEPDTFELEDWTAKIQPLDEDYETIVLKQFIEKGKTFRNTGTFTDENEDTRIRLIRVFSSKIEMIFTPVLTKDLLHYLIAEGVIAPI